MFSQELQTRDKHYEVAEALYANANPLEQNIKLKCGKYWKFY